jgi:hypothetical protein
MGWMHRKCSSVSTALIFFFRPHFTPKTQVLLKFHEYYVPVLELSLSTTIPYTETQLIIKILVLNSST